MLRSTLKSFYRNGKYVFMVAGIVYLALLLFLFSLVRALVAICGENIQTMFNEIVRLLNDYVTTFSVDSVSRIPDVWRQLAAVIGKGTEEFAGQIVAVTLSLAAMVVLFCEVARSFVVVSIKRERVVGGGLLSALAAIGVRTVLSLAFAALFVWLAAIWIYSVFFLLLVYLAAKALLNVFMVKLTRYRSRPLARLLRPKTLISLQLLYVLAFLITLLVAAIFLLAFHLVLALLLVLPVAIYLSACVEGNSYELFRMEEDVPRCRRKRPPSPPDAEEKGTTEV